MVLCDDLLFLETKERHLFFENGLTRLCNLAIILISVS